MRKIIGSMFKKSFSQFFFGSIDSSSRSYIFKNNVETYAVVQWVAQCVDKIIADILAQPFNFYNKETGEIIEWKNLNKDVGNLFGNNVNDLKAAVIAQTLINGNAYILKTQQNAYDLMHNKPSKLQLLRADKMVVNLSLDSLSILSYTSSQTGKIYEPKDIIHFKQTPVYNSLVGVGNIEKIIKLAQTDKEQQELEYQFMNNRGMSPFIVSVEGDLPIEEDQIKAKRDFDDKINNNYNAGKAHIFWSNGKINVHNIPQQNIKDILPIERDQYRREQVLTIFGVPPSVLGIPNSSQKNTDMTQEEKYYRSTINPKIKYLDDVLNAELISLIDPTIEIRTKKIAIADTKTIISQISSGIITPNRAAELLGEETNWEDQSRNSYYINQSLVPLDGLTQAEQAKKKTIIKSDLDLEIKSYINEVAQLLPPKKQFQVRYLTSAYITKKNVFNKFINSISDFYDAQIEAILLKVEENWASIVSLQQQKLLSEATLVSIVLQIDEQQKNLAKIMKPIYTSTIQRTIFDINKINDAQINLETSNPFVSSAIRKLGERITSGYVDASGNSIFIGETTRKQFENIIVESINQNLSLADVQEKIASLGEQWAGTRSRMIARTEISKAHDYASYIAFSDLQVKFIDVVGCTQFEPDTDCGKQNIPIEKVMSLVFHPNHVGTVVPSYEV